MLADAPIVPNIPAEDLDRARSWYEEKLGLTPVIDMGPGGLVYVTGATQFLLYPTQFARTGKHTLAGWVVPNLDATVAELRERGVTFQDYAMEAEGGPTTVDGVARDPNGGAVAWFVDSEGNVLSIVELPPGMEMPGGE